MPEPQPSARWGESIGHSAAPVQPASRLPLPLTTFIGRERELSAAVTALEATQLLTLTGPGGTGKTRLAIELARRLHGAFKDGTFVVNLAPVFDPALVVPTIAHALGVSDRPSQSHLASVASFLVSRHTLIVLDNFEQVARAGPDLVELLQACPHLWLLLTSRESVRISGERELQVPPLELPKTPSPREVLPSDLDLLKQNEAVRLFVERAQAVNGAFTLTDENARAVAEMCHRLDGLPLAIELAAARIRVLTPQGMLEKLVRPSAQSGAGADELVRDPALQFLTGGVRDLPDRQQTLRATIAWSHGLLSTPEQTVFRRLSAFVGGCSLEAAEAAVTTWDVGDHRWSVPEQETLNILESLVAKNLLRSSDTSGAGVRFTMLETIRAYGLECLAEAGELISMRRWHAMYFVELAERAEPLLRGSEQFTWLGHLERDHDNLRAAMEWALAHEGSEDMALRCVGALAWFWPARAHVSEGRHWLQRCLGFAGAPAQRLKALYGAAWLAHIQRDGPAAQAILNEALPLARALGDRWAEAWVLHLAGREAYFSGSASQATALAQESLEISRSIPDRWLEGWAIHLLALAAHIANDYQAAWEYYDRSIDIRLAIGFREGAGICTHLKGMVALRRGDVRTALTLVREGVLELQRMGATWTIHNGVATWAAIAVAFGQHAAAARLLSSIQAFSEVIDVTPIPLAETLISDTLAEIRRALAPAELEAAWAEGRALTLDQAIRLALELSPPVETEANPGPVAQPQGLSPRELEVLRLLAAGRTTREIAEQLVVSIATVERHITHIYTKLGVRSRAEATAFAVRHGI